MYFCRSSLLTSVYAGRSRGAAKRAVEERKKRRKAHQDGRLASQALTGLALAYSGGRQHHYITAPSSATFLHNATLLSRWMYPARLAERHRARWTGVAWRRCAVAACAGVYAARTTRYAPYFFVAWRFWDRLATLRCCATLCRSISPLPLFCLYIMKACAGLSAAPVSRTKRICFIATKYHRIAYPVWTGAWRAAAGNERRGDGRAAAALPVCSRGAIAIE